MKKSSKVLIILLISLYSLYVIGLYTFYQPPTPQSNTTAPSYITVEISALPGTGSVTFRGVEVLQKWLNPNDVIVTSSTWIENSSEFTYTSTDTSPLIIEIPNELGNRITFNTGSGQGTVQLKVGSSEICYNLSEEETLPQGKAFDIPLEGTTSLFGNNPNYTAIIILLTVAFVMLVTIPFLKRK